MTHGRIAAELRQGALHRDLRGRIEDFEAGEHLVHRLGQVGFRHPRHSRDEKHVDDQGTRARSRRRRLLGSEGDEQARFLEPALTRFVGKGHTTRRELAVGRDIIPEGVRRRRRRRRRTLCRSRLLLRRREESERSLSLARGSGRSRCPRCGLWDDGRGCGGRTGHREVNRKGEVGRADPARVRVRFSRRFEGSTRSREGTDSSNSFFRETLALKSRTATSTRCRPLSRTAVSLTGCRGMGMPSKVTSRTAGSK